MRKLYPWSLRLAGASLWLLALYGLAGVIWSAGWGQGEARVVIATLIYMVLLPSALGALALWKARPVSSQH